MSKVKCKVSSSLFCMGGRQRKVSRVGPGLDGDPEALLARSLHRSLYPQVCVRYIYMYIMYTKIWYKYANLNSIYMKIRTRVYIYINTNKNTYICIYMHMHIYSIHVCIYDSLQASCAEKAEENTQRS